MSAVVWSRRTAWVWVLIAMLAAIIVYLEGPGRQEVISEHEETGRPRVFDFTESELGAVEIVYQDRRTTLMRGRGGQWFNHGDGHHHGPGSQNPDDHHRAEEGVANQIREQIDVSTRMLADRHIVPDRALAEYGLERPGAIFAFYMRNGDAPDFRRAPRMLYVGDLLPTQYAYYTRLDEEQRITLIPRYQVALLLRVAFGEEVAPSPLPPIGPTTDR